MRSLPVDVTVGPRANILNVVETSPGIHLRAIERDTRLPLGQVLYHLDRLERMGVLVSSRDAGFRRFYAARGVGRGEKRFLAALRQAIPRRVLLALLEHGPLHHKALQERTDVAASTLSFHLQRLVAAEVVARERIGTMNVYQLRDAAMVRRELIFYRGSFRDPEVDRYVRAQLAPLPS